MSGQEVMAAAYLPPAIRTMFHPSPPLGNTEDTSVKLSFFTTFLAVIMSL